MVLVPVLLGSGFALGLAWRRRLASVYALLMRVQIAGGLGALGLSAGWAFEPSPGNVTALAVLLAAQTAAVLAGARLWRRRADGSLMAFALWGNPGVWGVPVTAALFGPRAAAWLAVYDMVFQPRIALGLRLLRRDAPTPQSRRTAFADYAPTALTCGGLALGAVVPAPGVVVHGVSALGIALATTGAVLLGIAWPPGPPVRTPALGNVARIAAVHFTVAPAIVAIACLSGLDLPPGMVLLLAGPAPLALVLFARLYGYSTRLGATALALSVAMAVALLPGAAWVAERV
jgi:predicted permease